MSVINETAVADQSDPAIGAVLIDYSAGNQVVVGAPRFLYITTAGNLHITTARGETLVMPVVTGVCPIKVVTIFQASSSAAGVIWY